MSSKLLSPRSAPPWCLTTRGSDHGTPPFWTECLTALSNKLHSRQQVEISWKGEWHQGIITRPEPFQNFKYKFSQKSYQTVILTNGLLTNKDCTIKWTFRKYDFIPVYEIIDHLISTSQISAKYLKVIQSSNSKKLGLLWTATRFNPLWPMDTSGWVILWSTA